MRTSSFCLYGDLFAYPVIVQQSIILDPRASTTNDVVLLIPQHISNQPRLLADPKMYKKLTSEYPLAWLKSWCHHASSCLYILLRINPTEPCPTPNPDILPRTKFRAKTHRTPRTLYTTQKPRSEYGTLSLTCEPIISKSAQEALSDIIDVPLFHPSP